MAAGLGSEWSLALRDGGQALDEQALAALGVQLGAAGPTPRFEARRLLRREGECEEWERRLSHELPVPPWETRELARELTPGGKVPVRPLRNLQGLLKLVEDLGLGSARALPVLKQIRRSIRGECTLEHARFRLAGKRWETLALSCVSLEPIREVRPSLEMPADARSVRVASYPAFLRGVEP